MLCLWRIIDQCSVAMPTAADALSSLIQGLQTVRRSPHLATRPVAVNANCGKTNDRTRLCLDCDEGHVITESGEIRGKLLGAFLVGQPIQNVVGHDTRVGSALCIHEHTLAVIVPVIAA
jgi:hypothetical protein